MRAVRPTYRQVFAVVAVIVSVYFGVRTSHAVVVDRLLASQLQTEQEQVHQIELRNAAMQAEVAYAQTPAYAEQVAREQLGLTKAGDHVVHVHVESVASTAAAAVVPAPKTAAPAPSVAPITTWQRWLRLFLDPGHFSTTAPS